MANSAANSAPATDRIVGAQSGFVHRLSRDHPRIWSSRLDLAFGFAVVAVPLSIVSAFVVAGLHAAPGDANLEFGHGADEMLIAGVLVWYAICALFSVFWAYSTVNAIHLPYAPGFRRHPTFLFTQFANFLIILPPVIFLPLCWFLMQASGIKMYFEDNLSPGPTPGIILWATLFSYVIACFVYVYRGFGAREAFLSAIVGLILGAILLGVPAFAVESNSFDKLAVTLIYPGMLLFLSCILPMILLRYKSSGWFGSVYPALFLITNPFCNIAYLFASVAFSVRATTWLEAYAYEAGALLVSVLIGWWIASLWEWRQYAPSVSRRTSRRGGLQIAKSESERPGVLQRYLSTLSRDFPVIWSLRLDIVLVVAMAVSVLVILVVPGMPSLPRLEDYLDPVRLALKTAGQSLQSIFSQTEIETANRNLADGLRSFRSGAWYSLFFFGTLLAVSAFYWIYSVGDTLKLPFAPVLRRIPEVFSIQLCLLLLSLPLVLTFALWSTAVDVILATEAPTYAPAETGPPFDGPYALAGILSAASALGAFASLNRRWGFLDALIATVVALVLMTVLSVLSTALELFAFADAAAIVVAIWITLSLLWRSGSQRPIVRRLIHGPAYYAATAGALYYVIGPALGWNNMEMAAAAAHDALAGRSLADWGLQLFDLWPLLLGMLIPGYLVSAIMIHIISGGARASAMPQTT